MFGQVSGAGAEATQVTEVVTFTNNVENAQKQASTALASGNVSDLIALQNLLKALSDQTPAWLSTNNPALMNSITGLSTQIGNMPVSVQSAAEKGSFITPTDSEGNTATINDLMSSSTTTYSWTSSTPNGASDPVSTNWYVMTPYTNTSYYYQGGAGGGYGSSTSTDYAPEAASGVNVTTHTSACHPSHDTVSASATAADLQKYGVVQVNGSLQDAMNSFLKL